MPTYDKDNNLIFDPEPEVDQPVLPNQVKVLRPKKYKTKMTAKRKSNIKRTLIKTAIVLTILVSAITYGTYQVSRWFEKNTIKWQSPIQTPVWIEPREQPASRHDVIKEAEAKEIDFSGATFIQKQDETTAKPDQALPLQDIVYKVYRLESSAGVNDGCRAKGLFNGYGYRQNKREWKCFGSHEEVTKYVTDLFAERIPKMGLSTALCYYQSGYKVADCEYYQKFLAL